MIARGRMYVRVVALGAFGFVLGSLGMSTATHTSLTSTLLSFVFHGDTGQDSQVCTLQTHSDEEDIFFLSCGGIY